MKKNINKIIAALVLLFTPLIVKAVALPNPLANVNSVPDLARNVIQGILGVIGAVALYFLIQGGLMWTTSLGNPESIKKGKSTILWAILGLAFILFSYALLGFLFCGLTGASCL